MKHFFLSTALLIFTASIQAQLTIGSGQTPEKGALLHLKEHEPDNQNITSTKGLSLPRVALSDKNNLFPMFETVAGNGIANDKYNTLAKKENQDAIHTGLIVYNTSTQINIIKPENTCANVDWSGGSANIILAPGIYVWNGQFWESLMPQESEKDGENKLPSWFGEGVGLLKDIEGNLYTTMDFNSAGTWMTQNLQYLIRRQHDFPCDTFMGANKHTQLGISCTNRRRLYKFLLLRQKSINGHFI